MSTRVFLQWIVCCVLVKHIFGLSLQMNGSSYGVEGERYTLFCYVTPIDRISVNVIFQRNIDVFKAVCGVNSACVERFPVAGYNCGCVSSSGETRVYNLTIQSLNVTDDTNWRCQHGTSDSNSFVLNVYTPVTSVTLEVSGSTPGSVVVVEGRSVEFTCFIQGAKPAPTTSQVSWYRQDKSGSNFTLPGSPATPTTDDRNTSVNYSYTADRQHHSDRVFCAARNSLMENRGDSDVTSTNKIQLNLQWPPNNPVSSGCPSSYISSSTTGTCHCSTSDSGNPAGNTSWFEPDGTNTGTDDLVLNTIPRKYNNRGYKCKTQNIHGSKEIIFTPKLAFGPESVTVTGNKAEFDADGRNILTLKCTSSSSSPNVTFTWKNLTSGQEIISGGPVREEDAGDGGKQFSQNLTITPVWFQDNNTIRCQVKNTAVSVERVSDIVLDLIYPPLKQPVISGYETGNAVYEGDTINLTCVVTGGKPLVTSATLSCFGGYSMTSSKIVGDSVVVHLNFPVTRNVSMKTCQCSAQHKTGRYSNTDTKTLTVYYPSSIPSLTASSNFPWLERENRNLTCSVTERGNPPADFVWYKNGVKQSGQSKSVWQFRNLTYKDNEQTFRCEAQNNCTLHKNEVKSSPDTTLNVFYSPQVTIDKSGPITKREGQKLEKIGCTADSNPPNSTITWTSDSDKPWKGGLPLEIAVLDRGQHGTYTCKATVTSSLGTLTGTSQIEIIVNYAPDVEVTSQTTSEGHKLTVTCEAFGRPDSYTFHGFQQSWRDQFVRKVEGTKEERNKYVWTVQSASYKDSGTYQCLVDNTIKDTNNRLIQSNTTLVVVSGKPVITLESKRDETVGEETSTQVTLYKTVFSQSEITSHKWMKNSDVINDTRIKSEMTKTQITLSLFENVVVHDGGYNFTLDITMFEESDTGQYRLEVCNNFTCDIFSTNLTAAGPPYMPRSFSAFGSTTDTVFLKWTADFAGGPYTQRFLVEYRDTDTKSDWIQQWYNEHAERDEVVFMNITGLNSGHTYVFRLLAENSRNLRNRSPFTSEVTIETKVGMKTSSDVSSGTWIAVGFVTGLVVTVLVGAMCFIVLLRQGYLSLSSKRENQKNHVSVYENVSLEATNQDVSNAPISNSDNTANTYEGLGSPEPTPYSKLELYENYKN